MNSSQGTVNSEVTDALTQMQAALMGQAPGQAMAMLDVVMAETLGMGMHNAITTQQNMQMVSGAAVTAACARMLNAHPPSPPPPLAPKPADGGTTPAELSARIAQDSQKAQTAVNQLVQDAASASSSATAAQQSLEKLAKQAEAGTSSSSTPDAGGSGGGSGANASDEKPPPSPPLS